MYKIYLTVATYRIKIRRLPPIWQKKVFNRLSNCSHACMRLCSVCVYVCMVCRVERAGGILKEERERFSYLQKKVNNTAGKSKRKKRNQNKKEHLFLVSLRLYRPPFFAPPRGGVIGRPDSAPPYEYLDFFSAGFKIWNEHMSVSSTDIMAPALSNSPQ